VILLDLQKTFGTRKQGVLRIMLGRMPFLPPNQQRQSTEGFDAKQQ